MKQPNRYRYRRLLTKKLCTNIIIQQLKANKLYESINILFYQRKKEVFYNCSLFKIDYLIKWLVFRFLKIVSHFMYTHLTFST